MRIITVCGMGFGTSLMLLMSIQKIGTKYNMSITGEAVDLSSLHGLKADLIVASSQIAKEIRDSDIPVIGITNMLDEDEIEAKVIPVLQNL